jgi:hypothetical protein
VESVNRDANMQQRGSRPVAEIAGNIQETHSLRQWARMKMTSLQLTCSGLKRWIKAARATRRIGAVICLSYRSLLAILVMPQGAYSRGMP